MRSLPDSFVTVSKNRTMHVQVYPPPTAQIIRPVRLESRRPLELRTAPALRQSPPPLKKETLMDDGEALALWVPAMMLWIASAKDVE